MAEAKKLETWTGTHKNDYYRLLWESGVCAAIVSLSTGASLSTRDTTQSWY